MKKVYTFFFAVLVTAIGFAQAPQKMSYQAVIRNSSNALVTSSTVGMKISILQGSPTGTTVYVETQTPTSNANGLVTIEIGGGTPVIGTFAGIDWSAGSYFIKTETDHTGGTNYTISGTSQLLSVPYALFAKTVASYTETDPLFVAHPANGISTTNITNWNTAYGWGNHIGLYRPFGWVPVWTDVTGKPTFATVATSGSYGDLTNKLTTGNGINIDGTNKIKMNIASQAAGDMIYFDGTNWIRIPKGNDDQILTLQAGVPVWKNQNFIPSATTTAATSITSTQATLNGIINANGLSTTVTFEYGTTTSYSSTVTATQSPVTGNTNTNVSATISGLTAGVTYHFRVKAVNALVTTYGSDLIILHYGDTYGGGLVFYIDGTGQHGLVCASTDQSTAAEWGCYGTEIGGTSSAINTEAANTNAIVAGCTTAGIAAKLCYDLDLNTYSDWSLPSKDELNLMYVNLNALGLGGFANNIYWSSSEYNSWTTLNFQFSNGASTNRNKAALLYVRAVRAF